MPNPHALLHRNLVQFLVIVCLRHILWLCLSLVVQKGCVIVRNTYLVLYVAEHMEKLLIIRLGIIKLFWEKVFEITIRATLPWLVNLVAFGSHGHHFLDSLLYHCTFKVWHTQDKLEEFS